MNAFIDISNVVLNTERLILRPWEKEDLNDFYEYASVDGVGEMAGWKHHGNIEESEHILNMFINGKITFALVLKENLKTIGSIGLEELGTFLPDNLAELRGREIGYVLSKTYWGQGLMREAVACVIDYCFKTLKLDFLICGHFIENTQSESVIRKTNFEFLMFHDYKTRMNEIKRSKMYILRNSLL